MYLINDREPKCYSRFSYHWSPRSLIAVFLLHCFFIYVNDLPELTNNLKFFTCQFYATKSTDLRTRRTFVAFVWNAWSFWLFCFKESKNWLHRARSSFLSILQSDDLKLSQWYGQEKNSEHETSTNWNSPHWKRSCHMHFVKNLSRSVIFRSRFSIALA